MTINYEISKEDAYKIFYYAMKYNKDFSRLYEFIYDEFGEECQKFDFNVVLYYGYIKIQEILHFLGPMNYDFFENNWGDTMYFREYANFCSHLFSIPQTEIFSFLTEAYNIEEPKETFNEILNRINDDVRKKIADHADEIIDDFAKKRREELKEHFLC